MSAPEANQSESLKLDRREERIGELLNDYLDRRARGEPLSQSEFLAGHPEFADELRDHLRGLDLIRDLGSSDAVVAPADGTVAASGSSGNAAPPAAAPPLPVIPGYDVIKQIGRGGMGIVYKAVQKSTKRVVALKVLMEGPFATDVAKRRFEREIALASQLRHPNIIPIHDSGNIDGRLYYAMEHVYGHAMGDYVRVQTPNLGARVRLFIKVCDAVSHAHQRGVIHRDLKPGNVLVDGSGTPHVLDFGLAKAGSAADMNTSMTAQIIGTPAYMSPEQAGGDPGGIDTRSDVYSLGVVLYEILTGRMPYDTNVAMGRILHNIANTEPEPPRRLNPDIDADLEAIVLKALDKDRDRRYQSVDALAGDLRRHLEGAPISAVPSTSLYLFRKALNRHRRVISLALLLLVAGGAATFFARRSSKNTQQTNAHLTALEERAAAQDARLAELERERESMARQRDEAVAARKTFESVLSELMPGAAPDDRRKFAGMITDLFTKSGREDNSKTLARLLASAASELGPSSTTTQPSGESPAPPTPSAGSAPSQADPYKRALQGLVRGIGQQMSAGAASRAGSAPTDTPAPRPDGKSTQP